MDPIRHNHWRDNKNKKKIKPCLYFTHIIKNAPTVELLGSEPSYEEASSAVEPAAFETMFLSGDFGPASSAVRMLQFYG